MKGRVADVLRKLPPPRDEAALAAARAVRAFIRGTPPPRPQPRPQPRSEPRAGADVEARLTKAFASGNVRRIREALDEVHRLNALAQQLASPPGTPEDVRLVETSGAKSLQYMVDLLPAFQKCLAEQPRGSTFTVLDVGPGTGAGTALLAAMYRRQLLGYRLKVAALDILPRYRWFVRALTPHVPFYLGDVFDHERTYDFVIASHVIEHVPDPAPFVRRLQELARKAVFITAPFNEPPERFANGHVSVIDEALMAELEPVEWTTMNSVGWGAFMDPPYEMVVARLAGRAQA